MDKFDVLIVGGGPAGATAATLCAQRGLSVALLEHKKFPRHKVCGDVINPNCWSVLDRLGAGEKIRALPHHKISGALFSTPNGSVIDVPGNGESMVAIRRSLFDACLLDHASLSGVTVFEGETAHEIAPRWRVVTKNREFCANILIGADGRHSPVARKTRLFCASRQTGNGHIAFQAHFRATGSMDDRVQLHLFPGGYCGVVRVDAHQLNLCIVTDRNGARGREGCEELFARTVWRNPQFRALGIVPEPLEPLQSAHPLWAPMNPPAADGVFLVGDALKTVEPFTGQGIYFALRTAELAADAICRRAGPKTYASTVVQLYRHRTRSNQVLRGLLYRHLQADVLAWVLRRWPGALRWLADNVLGE